MNQPLQVKAIVADNDPIVRRQIETILQLWGFSVIACECGEAAWSQIEKLDEPLLTVLDAQLPGIPGLEICRRIRTLGRDRTGYIFTILLATDAERSVLLQALERGVDNLLLKPISREKLRMAVHSGRRILTAAREQQELALELKVKSEVLECLYQDLDQKVLARTKALDEALNRAETASRMKSEFLANMSHEIRTPLNGIVSYTDLLLESQLNEEQRSDVEIIQSSAFSLKQIIDDILDLSKVEAGKLTIDNAPFKPQQVISNITSIIEPVTAKKGVELVVDIATSVPVEIVGDAARVQQVITNVLGNAVKFCGPKGGIIVRMSTEKIEAELKLRIDVANTGPAIPLDRQQAIFEAFQQADGSTTRKYGGTGLGLTICRKILDLMNGSITVVSRPRIGSLFSIFLPCEPALVIESPQTAGDAQSVWQNIVPLKILLAEDHIINRTALVRILEGKGHTVLTASSGLDVLLTLQESSVDIILMDVQMPQMGGDEATTLIRNSNAEWSKVPIIALTAHAYEDERQRLLSLGVNDYVTKPVNQCELATALSTCTSNDRTSREILK